MSIQAFKIGLFSAFALLGTLAATAATLTPNGVVMVNKGNGFERVTMTTELNPGDMVMVNEGGAQMAEPGGCITSLHPGQVYTVGNICVAGGAGGGMAGGAAGGIAGGVAGGTAGLSTTALVVGGVAVAGGAAAAIGASSSSKKSSSP